MSKNDLNQSAASAKPLLRERKLAWSGLRKKLKLLAPYLWPRNKLHLQVCFVVSFILQALVRLVALLIPIFFKKIVDNLSQFQRTGNNDYPLPSVSTNEPLQPQENETFHWQYIVLYVVLKALIGSGGYITTIRNSLWQLTLQYQKACLHIKLFQHIHSLSIRWHISRKTGEVIKVMERGVTGCTSIINVTVSQIVPVIADVIIAVIYFFSAFDLFIGLIVFFTLLLYALVTVLLSEWRTKYRRARNDAENKKASTAVDSILNVETVKLFAGETWEVERFTKDVQDFQKAEWWMHFTANMYASARVTVLNGGFLAGCILSAHYVTTGHFTTGDFVLFASYLTQLFDPLSMLGAHYRMLQQGFIDMEHMFDILETKAEVTDDPSAMPLKVSDGQIQFENVSFAYSNNKQIVNGISFTVNPGETLALVGKTGEGKTTLCRLLLRLYDIQAGKILIDGQDIAKVKINSLRQHIGVVPQDSAMFNDTAKHNIQYGKMSSTMTDVITAAKSAEIHDTISHLSQGYDTVLGEKGLRLSGGERQRVAIARMLLKDPKIVILDEATSALDTGTEQVIRTSLLPSCRGRTTIVIAHRLSTVVHANNIIVLKDGRIIESGTHTELLRNDGTYAQMWAWQQEHDEQAKKPTFNPFYSLQLPATTITGISPTNTFRSTTTSDGDEYSIGDIDEVDVYQDEEVQQSEKDIEESAGNIEESTKESPTTPKEEV